jgi:hypothetical protein
LSQTQKESLIQEGGIEVKGGGIKTVAYEVSLSYQLTDSKISTPFLEFRIYDTTYQIDIPEQSVAGLFCKRLQLPAAQGLGDLFGNEVDNVVQEDFFDGGEQCVVRTAKQVV